MTDKLDGQDAVSNHPMQVGTIGQHALNDHMNDINDFSWDDMFCNHLNEVRTSLISIHLGFVCESLIGSKDCI